MAKAKVGVMHMSSGSGGWQEKYHFDDATTYTNALDVMKNLVWGRSAFFASNVICVFARVSTSDHTPDRVPVPMRWPVGPHPSWAGGQGIGDAIGPTNDDAVAVQMASSADNGKWGNRYYRGCPDTWIQQRRLLEPIYDYFKVSEDNAPVTDLGPTSGLAHLAVCQKFWRLICQQVKMAKKTGPNDLLLTAIKDMQYQQITSKKTGRIFRVSAGREPALLVR